MAEEARAAAKKITEEKMSAVQDNDILAETENMIIWRSAEDQVGFMFHVELGGVSLHLLPEEWDELLILIRSIDA